MRDLFAVRGLIVPADWDDDERVTLVSLLTDDEGEYLVLADRAGRELVQFIHKRVEASGHLFRDDHGEQILRMEQFSLLIPDRGRSV